MHTDQNTSAQLARENNKKQNTCQKLIAISKTRIYTAGLHYNTSHIQMYTVFEKRGQIYKLKIDKMDTFLRLVVCCWLFSISTETSRAFDREHTTSKGKTTVWSESLPTVKSLTQNV